MGTPSGIRLGQALSDIQANARIKAAAVIGQAETAGKDRYLTHIMERFEAEIAPHLKPFLQDIVDHPETPEDMREFFGKVIEPKQQVGFFFDLISLIGIALGGSQAAAAGQLQRLQQISMMRHGNTPLSPQEAAVGVVKQVFAAGSGQTEARRSGMDAETFGVLVEMTGNPPGPQELGMMLRRGIINEGQFAKGIAQGITKTEWTDELMALRYSPIPAGNAVAAVVEGHMSMGELKKVLGENGIEPKWAEIMFETAGNPPGIHELLELMVRGDVSQALVEQAIRESNVKTKYIPELLKLGRRLPPMDNIRQAVRNGSIDVAQGVRRLMDLGYNNEDAQMLIDSVKVEKLEKTKDLAVSQITNLYEIQAIDQSTAISLFESMGYDADEAGFILAIADSRRMVRFQNAALNRIHTLFVQYRLDITEASIAMDGIGVVSAQRDELIQLWELEKAANVKPLTLAQLTSAFKKEIISEEEYTARLHGLGYQDRDADIIAALVEAGPLAVPDMGE